MKEITIAEEEAHHALVAAQDPPGLGVGAKSQTADGGQHTLARGLADVPAVIQYA